VTGNRSTASISSINNQQSPIHRAPRYIPPPVVERCTEPVECVFARRIYWEDHGTTMRKCIETQRQEHSVTGKHRTVTRAPHQILQSTITNHQSTGHLDTFRCRTSSVCASDLLIGTKSFRAQTYRDAAAKSLGDRRTASNSSINNHQFSHIPSILSAHFVEGIGNLS
jgi:hypothetical protein